MSLIGNRRWRRLAWPLLGLLILATLPAWAAAYPLRLVTEIMIYAILAMSLNLALGQTGLPSLGHAAFYGVGAYAAGYLAKHATPHLLVTLPTAVLAAGLVALVVGFLSVRAHGIYFLMLTLAFGQMLKAVAHSWTGVTGGPDGMASIPRPLLGLEGFGIGFQEPRAFFYLALLCFALVYCFLVWLAAAPFGRSLVGIRENERRMRAVGYNTFQFKLAAFTLASALAGLAGGLHAHLNGFVAAGDLDWSASAVVLIMVVIGGAGNLTGSVFGAALFVLVQNRLSSLTPYWHLYLGLLFILFVLAGGERLSGFIKRFLGRWSLGGSELRPFSDEPVHELRRAAGAFEHQPENSRG